MGDNSVRDRLVGSF